MVVGGRRGSKAFFIALGAGLILVILFLYVGWVLLNWRTGIQLFLGLLLLAIIIAGVVVNTLFLVREIRRNEQHDAFINAVTHELKTPVASIRLQLETLQAHALDDVKRKALYGIMLEDSDRLLGTIEQVLQTGRLGSAGRKLHHAPIDLGAEVEACLTRVRKLYKVSEEALVYSPGPAVTVLGDLDEIQSAIANLIDNAVKYSGKDIHVRVETMTEGGYVSLRVTDKGAGVPRGELERIFKRFHRLPLSPAARVKGTGLGLFIVRSVAKRHGGRAWAESDGPGRGSTFVLKLPVAR